MADEVGTKSLDSPPSKKSKNELRKYSKLPITIVENHDSALYPIQRAIASKHLPFTGVTLVHFDSHPDLTIPAKMSADIVFDTARLAEEISIADWILPEVYAGHVNRVVWIKPEWAHQMEGVVKRFFIGKHKKTGYLRVTCKDDYFVEELLYAPFEELDNPRELQFMICTLTSVLESTQTSIDTVYGKQTDKNEKSSTNEETNTNYIRLQKEEKSNTFFQDREKLLGEEKELFRNSKFEIKKKSSVFPAYVQPLVDLLKSALDDEESYVLDIDMDFFSTKNPFKELFDEDEFQCLKDVYRFTTPLTDSDKDFHKCIEQRSHQLKTIESTYDYADHLDMCSDHPCTHKTQVNEQLLKLLKEIKSCGTGEKPDHEIIHSAGMTIDIPHHISTKQEIDNLLTMIYYTISSLWQPTMVTIARSTYDEYTPPHQIDYIQDALIRILNTVYGQDSIDINLDY